MKNIPNKEKVFYALLFSISIFIVFNVFIATFNVLFSTNFFGFKSPTITALYFGFSSVYLFYILFLDSIKNITFWKFFFFIGILILLFKDASSFYNHIFKYEEIDMLGIIFRNMFFGLFLYANYNYVFRLKNENI